MKRSFLSLFLGFIALAAPYQAVSADQAVVGLTLTVNHTVVLTWGASTSSGIVGYNIYRSTVSGSGYQSLTTAPVPALDFSDVLVVSGQTYYYVVRAVDSNGVESANSNEASVKIP